MSPEEQLRQDVDRVVNGVIGNFPFPIKDMLKKYADKLSINIVEISCSYVRAVIDKRLREDFGYDYDK